MTPPSVRTRFVPIGTKAPPVVRRLLTMLGALAITLLLSTPVSAQQTGTVEGTVTAPDGQLLASAQVNLAGTRHGALSGEDGTFQITNVPAGDYTLVAQLIGYAEVRQPVSVTADETVVVDIELQQRALELEQVVVTGVTEATARQELPFTVSQVTSDQIPIQPRSALGALQGRVAGVNVVPGAQPGTSDDLMLRTPTSINRSNQPLIVVDGVIMSGRSMDMSTMDIESIEVVKGAAAASLYGSRAGAGVIQIRTRRGTGVDEGRTELTVSTEIGLNEVANPIDFNQHHNFRMDAQGNFLGDDGQPVPDRFLAATTRFGFVDQEYPGGTFDHIDTFFNPGANQLYTASVAHNAGGTALRGTVGHQRDRGVVESHDGLERTDVRLNVDHRPTDNLSIAVTGFHMRSERDDMKYSGPGVFFDFIHQAADVDLAQPDPDGTPFHFQPDQFGIRTNPLYSIYNETSIWEAKRVMGGFDLRYNPISWLAVDANLSYDRSDRLRTVWVPRGVKTPDRPDGDPGFGMRDARETEAVNASAGISANRDFGDVRIRSAFRALLEREDEEFVQAQGSEAAVGGLPDLGVNRSQFVSTTKREIRSEGYFGTLEVGYDDRYNLNTLVRLDGSSLFGPEERWHTYYRLSGGWRVANEDWWGFPNINQFRIRASQGTAGGRPSFADRFETFSVGTGGSLSLTTLGNERLQPEQTREREIGLDMTFHQRYSVSFTAATQRTEEQLLLVPLPNVFGFGQQWVNAGTIEGNSFEIEVDIRAHESPTLSWDIGLVADRSSNRITEFNAPCFTTGQQRRCAGERIGRFIGNQFAKEFDHISNVHSDAVRDHFQVNDDGLLVAVGPGNSFRDGVSNELWGTTVEVEGETYPWGMPIIRVDDEGLRSEHVNGDATPDFSFGIRNQVQWRGVRIFALVDGQVGGDIENRTQQRQTQWLRSELVDQAGKPEELKKPAVYYSGYIYDGNRRNDWWVEPADHLRLRELAVSYTLDPQRLGALEGIGVERLTLSAVGRNLALLTRSGFTGFDPVSGSATNAQESFGFPSFRTYTFKVEAHF